MSRFVAGGAGFLLAVLWFDLMFDVQVLAHRRRPELPEPALASIAGYYRRVTTTARPMNRLVGVAMLATLAAIVVELARGDHPRWAAWTSLAPAMSNHNVAAGPFRLATIVLACLCALAVRRAWQARMPGDGEAWTVSLLAEVLWWAALALALRSFFEPVMVSYYPWPPMAVALLSSSTTCE